MASKIRIYELSRELKIPNKEIISEAKELGIEVKSHSSSVTEEEAELIKESFSELTKLSVVKQEEKKKEVKVSKLPDVQQKNLQPRAPIVTVMGHVDHGKTLILDAIRNTNVIGKESGGITQHIGASRVSVKGKGDITFIDTPGHKAFTAMRARGAGITDIVVLVVAADDGVMPQTVEAINHAASANVPIIVAINKMDLPDADAEKIRTQLSKEGIILEKWGGDVIDVEVSAKEKTNLNELLEMILLQAELMELASPVDVLPKAVVVESEMDRQIGPVATVIITEGVLNTGDAFICGLVSGKVRALFDHAGIRITSASPSVPVKILGFDGLPSAGDTLDVVSDKTFAREIVKDRQKNIKKDEVFQPEKLTLEDLRKQLLGEESKELRIILKTDVSGSLEAIRDALLKLKTDEVLLKIIHSAVSGITKEDIMLASASGAIIIGFNISPSGSIKKEADRVGVQIRTYRIIYEIIDDIKDSLKGMLEPELEEVVIGRAEIKKIYNISRVGTIAGSSVIEGVIRKKVSVRIIRDSKIVYQGKLASLKRFKKDAAEVQQGYECGMRIENFNDVKVADIIESFQQQDKK